MNGLTTQMIDGLGIDRFPYPEEAFEFVREGLPYAVRRTHGAPTEDLVRLELWLAKNNIDYDQCEELYDAGRLPAPVIEAIEELGGVEKLNRHVTGQELCWGLRDLAVKRWGLLARTVLRKWKIKTTEDFGRIVFDLIEREQLRKQAGDTLDDFRDVYDFNEAFDTSAITEPSD